MQPVESAGRKRYRVTGACLTIEQRCVLKCERNSRDCERSRDKLGRIGVSPFKIRFVAEFIPAEAFLVEGERNSGVFGSGRLVFGVETDLVCGYTVRPDADVKSIALLRNIPDSLFSSVGLSGVDERTRESEMSAASFA